MDDEPLPDTPTLRLQRTIGQVGLIRRRLPDVVVAPADWEQHGDVAFLHRADTILVRNADVPEVLGRLRQLPRAGNGTPDPVSSITPHDAGFHRITTTDLPLDAVLRGVNGDSGLPIAAPDHVLHVTGYSFCPATEPLVPLPLPDTPSGLPTPGINPNAGDGSGKTIQVIDTGWSAAAAAEHSWLVGVSGDAEASYAGLLNNETGEPWRDIVPYAGHGTFVAGVVRAAAPASDVHIAGLLPAFTGAAAFESDIVDQMWHSIGRQAPDVITISAGGNTFDDREMLAFSVLYETVLKDLGTVVVAAAGNDSSARKFYPAAFDWAVGVGALDATEQQLAWFTNHGPWVDVYARGGLHANAFLHGEYVTQEPQSPKGQKRDFSGMAIWSGTSFAAPLVAGMIARRATQAGISTAGAWSELRTEAARTPVAMRGDSPLSQRPITPDPPGTAYPALRVDYERITRLP